MDSPPEVLVTTHDSENFVKKAVPLVHDPRVADAHDEEAASDQRTVPSAIVLALFGGRVPRIAVGFDDQSITDEQVHPSNSHDRDLDPHANSSRTQSQPRQSLDPGLAPPVGGIQHSGLARAGEP